MTRLQKILNNRRVQDWTIYIIFVLTCILCTIDALNQ